MAGAAVCFFLQHVRLLPLLLLLCCLSPTAILTLHARDCFPPDLQALRAFAPYVASASDDYDYDDYGSLEEIWRGNDCCSWQGISCTDVPATTGEPPRVSGLSLYIFNLSNMSSTGNLLQPLCNLSLLSTLFLQSTSEDTRPDFYTLIPACLGHLSALRNLSLYYLPLQGPLPSSFSRLLHLQYLDVSNVEPNICLVSGTLRPISNLPNLTYVDFSNCAFSGPLPPFRTPLLQHLDLSQNSLNSTLLDFSLLSNLPSLITLDLSFNHISGSIPLLSNLPSLITLDLSSNQISGSIPLLSNLPPLTSLDLSSNQISGSIPPSMFASLPNLAILDLGSNRLSGEMPESFCKLAAFNTSLDSLDCKFINLTQLSLAENRFTGPFPRWISHLPSLSSLDLSGNDFRGPLPDGWKNLQMLRILDLSGNAVLLSQYGTARLPDWLFHFPLQSLSLASCGLQTQDLSCSSKLSLFNQSLYALHLTDNHLTGRDTLECFALHNFSQRVSDLDLSRNPLSIVLSNVLLPPHVDYLYLSSCNLKGVDPLVNAPLQYIFMDLSHNALAMDLPSLLASIRLNCDPKNLLTEGIDLSHNALVGEIPSSLGMCNQRLATIRLHNNSLVGHIPDQLGSLALEILRLDNNHLKGTIPASIMGVSSLTILDLRYNDLEGNLNTLFSFSNTTYLRAVLLSYNRINGAIPLSFGTFMPDLQLIDFSNNRITGTIPQKLYLPYFRNLKPINMELTTHPFSAMGTFEGLPQLVVKGVELDYEYVLDEMTYMDLSGNYLEGNIPEEMGDLTGLLFLNLSHNNLSGSIPSTLAKLTQLQSLDLSFNQLEGSLPSEFSNNLTKLSTFNVSFNTGLRGSIPQGPQFETSESYKGDPLLCGSPILQDCKPSIASVVPHTTTVQPAGSIIARWIDEWIAIPGLSLGIVVGFVITLFFLHYKRTM